MLRSGWSLLHASTRVLLEAAPPAWTPTRSGARSPPCPASSRSTTCTYGRSPRASSPSPPTSSSRPARLPPAPPRAADRPPRALRNPPHDAPGRPRVLAAAGPDRVAVGVLLPAPAAGGSGVAPDPGRPGATSRRAWIAQGSWKPPGTGPPPEPPRLPPERPSVAKRPRLQGNRCQHGPGPCSVEDEQHALPPVIAAAAHAGRAGPGALRFSRRHPAQNAPRDALGGGRITLAGAWQRGVARNHLEPDVGAILDAVVRAREAPRIPARSAPGTASHVASRDRSHGPKSRRRQAPENDNTNDLQSRRPDHLLPPSPLRIRLRPPQTPPHVPLQLLS